MRRLCECALSAAALVLLSPVILIAAAAIVLVSGPPVFYSQTRVGLNAQPFRLWKFRSMRGNQAGSAITIAGDRRITRVGKWLRRTKIDELPQLFNVLTGSMSFIGPRPEIPAFVDPSKDIWRSVLSVRPGLLDPASLDARDETLQLARYSDPLAAYREIVLPRKLAVSLDYLQTRDLASDLKLIAKTTARLISLRL